MKYAVRINKRVNYVKNYRTLKKVSGNLNFATRLLLKLVNRKKEEDTHKL
jgi:hypothetical protein